MTADLKLVPTEDATKSCPNCKQILPLTAFYRNGTKQNPDRRQPWCKKCVAAQSRKYRNDPVWRSRAEWHLFKPLKTRAKKLGVPFNLELSDIFIPEFCPVLGIKLERTMGRGVFPDNRPSVDRLIPSRGYTKGNIAIISGRANKVKYNGTAAELEKIAAWMRSQGLP